MRKIACTVYYDDSGELYEIKFSPQFKRESVLMQADVLGDMEGEFGRLYREGLDEFYGKLS